MTPKPNDAAPATAPATPTTRPESPPEHDDSVAESIGHAIVETVTVPASPEGSEALGSTPHAVGGQHSRP